jgi:hypothetical protein
MWTISFIRAHLNRIPSDAVFSTRDFLCYGNRSTVDSALHRLVKREVIIRLARGVFIKWSIKAARGNLPPAEEVARVKARGFGKEIFVHKKDASAKLGLVESGNESPKFGTFGRSTSFRFGDQRIELAHVSPKDARLGDSFIGLLIRALKDVGNHDQLSTTLMRQMAGLTRNERNNLCLSVAMMPGWLSDRLCSEKIAIMRIKGLSAA